ncbi:hypothetical protein CWO91_13935 [Bradyrhizobium genosp. SA-3]|nr:hypothetical protein CWO91_13935 [Bradyrhizobium genosp. SA-3]
MASAVGIVLILMIVTWLGLWGPVDLSHLKEWQTLTTGLLALFAAGIAYLGATAKVRHDREVLALENSRRRLALYLKIEMAFRALARKAHDMQSGLMFPPLDQDKIVDRSTLFAIEEPPELEEAWTYLDLFPREALAEIRAVRSSLRDLVALSEVSDQDQFRWGRYDKEPPWIVGDANVALHQIWQSATLVADALAPLIKRMAPEMDQNERLTRIYGEPNADEI